MPTATKIGKRQLTRDDIMPLEDYVKVRRDKRREITELKRRRRIEVGPVATFYFDSFASMWQQVHDMLYIEKGGEEQIAEPDLKVPHPRMWERDFVTRPLLELRPDILEKP